MRNIVIVAAIAAVAAATPALAGPGNGHGHGNKGEHGGMNHASAQRGDRGAYGAWGNSCPPGLAKKNNGCQPPGQARKRYNIGQRWSNNYGQSWSYNQIPQGWRQQYNLNQNDRYYYRDGYLYQVNPRTNLVSQVLSAILR